MEHDWNGEPVKVFGPKRFWSLLRREREHEHDNAQGSETAMTERMVWSLGSTRYADP